MDSEDSAAKVRLYYFEGRNTGIAATSASEARKKKKRGGDKIVAVRTPTEQERKKMRRGEWVRTRKDGKSPDKSKHGKGRGYGPPRDKASNMTECTDEACTRSFLTEEAMLDHAEIVHTLSDIQNVARRAVRDRYGKRSGVMDMGDNWIVAWVWKDDSDHEDEALFKVSYTLNDGSVSLGDDDTEVVRRTAYIPAVKQESAAIAMRLIGVTVETSERLNTTSAVGGRPPSDRPHAFAQEEGQTDPLVCSDCGRHPDNAIHS